MGNLMDDIKRFKVMRQEAIPPQQDELDALVTIYEAIKTPGQESLRQEFSKRWDVLSEQKKAELVDRLLKKDLLPPQVEDALRIFNGKIVSLL